MRGVWAICILALLFASCTDTSPNVCSDSKCYEVEIARTPEQRAVGLMFRESMDGDTGMLFIFDQERNYPFWMKNTLIPLDMIWIDSGFRIVDIEENAQPCGDGTCNSITPEGNALYVLELNAGQADAAGMVPGSYLTFRNIK